MHEKQTVIVRVGVPDDIGSVMKLAEMNTQENGLAEADPRKIFEVMRAGLARHRSIIGVVGPVGGVLEGGILLRVGPHWYTEQHVLEEQAIFVHPDYRGLRDGSRVRALCEWGKQVALQMNVPLVVGILSNHRTAGKMRLYESIFGPCAGAYFLYNGRTGAAQQAAE